MTEAVVHTNAWYKVVRCAVGHSEWYRVVRPDSAMAIVLTEGGQVVMVRGTRDTTGPDEFLEFPCGAMEAGEAPAQAAIRETLEETGHRIDHLRAIGSFVEVPGISESACHVFTASSIGVIEATLGGGEDWTVELLPLARMPEAIAAGRVRDGGTLAAWSLLLAQRHSVGAR